MSQIEKHTGEGPWVATYVDGRLAMVEIRVRPGERLVMGNRDFEAPCARCRQVTVACCTPENDEKDMCPACTHATMMEVTGAN